MRRTMLLATNHWQEPSNKLITERTLSWPFPSICRPLLRARCERPRRRLAAEQRDEIAAPHRRSFSGFEPHITTPLRTNAAVHHSKDSALMSQMGHHARVGSHRVTYAGVAVKTSSNPSQSEPSRRNASLQ